MTSSRKYPPKAYQNPDFLLGDDGRIVRVLSEYLEPASRLALQRVKDTVVFFGSARILPREESASGLKSCSGFSNRDRRGTSRRRMTSAGLNGRSIYRAITKRHRPWHS